MFNWFKKEQPKAKPLTIRDTLFGDMSIAQWAKDENAHLEPWTHFVKARKSLEAKDNTSAIAALAKDPMGAALIDPATQLMLKLTQLRKK